MHGYYWSPLKLRGLLLPFIGGHFLVYKKGEDGFLYRGKISNLSVPENKRRIIITFEWVVAKKVGCTVDWKGVVQWERRDGASRTIDVHYWTYYPQRPRYRGKRCREARLKFKKRLWGGEICRLYRPNDPFSQSLEKLLSVGRQPE